jgi:hypothetical protein
LIYKVEVKNMSEKKVVGRSVAIGLGIVVIILLVSLVGAVANYMLIINEKDNAIATKDSQIKILTGQITDLQN